MTHPHDTDEVPLDTPDGRVATARQRVLAKLPTLRVGDVWRGVVPRCDVTITRFRSQEDYAIPWPMVGYTVAGESIVSDTGAPAFMFGQLVQRGGGEEWVPLPAAREAA
jgi:hypothetical protein